jgi:hypothetical protein
MAFAISSGMKPLRQSTLIALAGLLMAGCNTPSNEAPATTTTQTSNSTNSAQPREASRAFVRGVHVVPGGPPALLMVDGKKATGNFTFGNASDFAAVEPGKIEVKALADSGKNLAGPMPVTLESGEDLTVIVNGVPGDVVLLPLKHKSGGPEAGQAKIAFMHTAKALPSIDILIDGERYRGDVDYGQNTEYRTLPPGKHNLQVTYQKTVATAPAPLPSLPPGATPLAVITPPPAKERLTLTQPVDLAAGKVYTLLVFHDAGRMPKLRLLEDRFANTLQNAPETAATPTAAP